MVRILIAGIVGGIAMFVGGAFSHMFLELETRAIKRLPSEPDAKTFFAQQALHAGMYGFPAKPENYDKLPSEERAAAEQRMNEEFKTGPAGYLVVAPTGEDMMGVQQLGGELVANTLAALLAAFLAGHFTMAASFTRRWLLIILLAPIAWFSLTLSFALWYRFPFSFIQDGLFAALIEWTLAGAAIAAIVRPIMHNRLSSHS